MDNLQWHSFIGLHNPSEEGKEKIFLPQLFARLSRENISGVLLFSSGDQVKQIFWDKGVIVFASSNNPVEQFGQRMLRQERLTGKQLHQVFEWQKDHNRTIFDGLVELGFFNKYSLTIFLRSHVFAVCSSLFSWKTGSYKLNARSGEYPEGIYLQPEDLVLESVRLLIDIEQINNFVGDIKVKSFVKTNDTYYQNWINAEEEKILRKIEEGISLFSSGNTFQIEKLKRSLCSLLLLSAIEPNKEHTKELTTETEIPEEFASSSKTNSTMELVSKSIDTEEEPITQEVESKPAENVTANNDQTPAIDFSSMAMVCYEVENMLGHVTRRGIDYFAILEVSRQASTEEVKAAYKRLSEKFEPTNYREITKFMPTLTSQLMELRLHFEKAYKVLVEPFSRAQYVQSLRESSKSSTGGLALPKAAIVESQKRSFQDHPTSIPTTKDLDPPQKVTTKENFSTQHQSAPLPTTKRSHKAVIDPTRIRNADDWYLLGLELVDKGDLDRAIRAFQSALRIRPQDAEFHAALARAFAQSYGFNLQTVEEFTKAIELQPESADYQAELGLFYLKHNRLEEAKAHILRSLKIDPNNNAGKKAMEKLEKQL